MMAVQVCVSEGGVPTAVTLRKSSDYADANEKVVADVRRWRFRPYMDSGHPVPVCTAAILQYSIADTHHNCGPRGAAVGNNCQNNN
jgi:TonB family protein